MNRSELMRAFRAAGCVALVTLGTAGCEVGVSPGVPVGYDDYPPEAYIATTEPYYYEGHASYWYGNRWYYRDGGGRWNHYDHEPPGLYQRRAAAPPGRRGYENYRGGARSGGGHPGHRR